MPLFNRQVSVLVGPEGSEEGILFEGIRVVFKITKTKKKDSNTCSVDLYNLSEATRNRIKTLEDLLIIKAGYLDAGGLTDLFTGNIVNINHIRSGPDIITRLEAGDGEKALREIFTKSYKEGTSVKQILNDVVAALGIDKKFIDSSIEDSQFVNGFSFSGPIKNIMDKLAGKLGFEWSIQNNEIQILKDGGTNQDTAIVISSDSGLIGSPERVEDLTKGRKKTSTKLPGWRIKSLLLPKINVGGTVGVESREIEKGSFFKVLNIDHSGDTHGENWETTLEVMERE